MFLKGLPACMYMYMCVSSAHGDQKKSLEPLDQATRQAKGVIGGPGTEVIDG